MLYRIRRTDSEGYLKLATIRFNDWDWSWHADVFSYKLALRILEKVKDRGYRYVELELVEIKNTVPAYLLSLKVGERVIETTPRTAFYRMKGVVVESLMGACLAVKWEPFPGQTGSMTTSITYGTRRDPNAAKTV